MAKAAAAQSRRNFIGASIIFSFVGAIFTYSIVAVGSDDNMITDADVAEFRREREKQRALERARR